MTTDTKLAEVMAQLRAALDAGPTPGPWVHWADTHLVIRLHSGAARSEDLRVCEVSLNTRHDESRKNAAFIAAANPEAISLILSELEAAQAERDSLRAFAQDLMEDWLDGGDVDGGGLQDFAVKHGLLRLAEPAPTAPCGEQCACSEYFSDEEWSDGIECYRRTPLLTGALQPAAEAAQANDPDAFGGKS